MMTRSRPSLAALRLVTAAAALVGVAVLMALPSAARGAEATGVVRYRGLHPLWPQMGGFCYIDVTHVHTKRPTDLRVYRVLPNDEFLFVGDPVALGYDGTKVAYFGPHPLAPALAPPNEKFYCYIRGPHFHAEKPQPAGSFVEKDGVSWFMGAFPPEFERDRHYLWINESAVMTSYQPPKVTLANGPPGYGLPAVAAVLPPVVVPPAAAVGAAAAKNSSERARAAAQAVPQTGMRTGMKTGMKQRVR